MTLADFGDQEEAEYVSSISVFFSWYGLSLHVDWYKNTAETVRFPAADWTTRCQVRGDAL